MQQKAYELGIDALQVTDAVPLERYRSLLLDKKDKQEYPAFAPTDIDLRITPQRLLPNVRSILSAAICYNTGEPQPPRAFHGSISRYAWGLDYHRVLLTRLEALARFLQKEAGLNDYYAAVDSRPPLERAIACRSGLGQVRKNCALYTPPYGSWVFLGELYIDVEIQPSEQPATASDWVSSPCPQSCQLCLQACPTKALYQPYQIDSYRCIGYLTQMDGIIPRELRPLIGNQLWGCDVCQAVCPVNTQATLSRHPEFAPLEATDFSLPRLLNLSNREFRQIFGKTAIAWRPKRILQRNAAVILGNQGWPGAVNILADQLQHSDRAVRAAAVWALGQIATPRAIQLLQEKHKYEEDHQVLAEYAAALAS